MKFKKKILTQVKVEKEIQRGMAKKGWIGKAWQNDEPHPAISIIALI